MAKRIIPDVEDLCEESQKLYDVLNEESDLACVLISASYLELALGALLKRHFIDDSASATYLGGSSLWRRADLAYSLGLIPEALHANLQIIAVIRNTFAHNYLMLDLNEGRFPRLVDSLRPYTIHRMIKIDEENKRTVVGPQPVSLSGSHREKFNQLVAAMVSRILLTGLAETHRAKQMKGWE